MPVPKGVRRGGRKKGTPNRKTQNLQERLSELGCDPVEGLAALAKDRNTNPELKAEILMDLMTYIHAKRRAVEVSGPEGNPLTIEMIDSWLTDLDDSPYSEDEAGRKGVE